MKSIFKILLLVGLCGTSLSAFNTDMDSFLVDIGKSVKKKISPLFGLMPPPLSGQEYKEAILDFYNNFTVVLDIEEIYDIYSYYCDAGLAPACGFLSEFYLSDAVDKFDPKRAKKLLIYAIDNTPDEPYTLSFRYLLDLTDEMMESGVKNVEDGSNVIKDAFDRAYKLCTSRSYDVEKFCFRAYTLIRLVDINQNAKSKLMSEIKRNGKADEPNSLIYKYRHLPDTYMKE